MASSFAGSSSRPLFIFLLAVSITAGLLFLRSTTMGIGVSPDSVAYLSSAQSIVDGQGVVDRGVPVVHYPPGYPALIAATSALTASTPLVAARSLGFVLTVANVLLLAFVVWRETHSPVATALSSLFLCSSFTFLGVHVMAWSEPAFILFVFTGLMLLNSYLRSGSTTALWCASMLFAAAILTRHVGVMLIPVLAYAVLRLDSSSARTRLRRVFVASFLTLGPFCLWLVRNSLRTTSPSDWAFAFHPVNREHWKAFSSTVFQFLTGVSASAAVQSGVTLALLALLTGGYIATMRASSAEHRCLLTRLLACFVVAYVGFVLFSITTYSAETPLDNRILLPALVAVLALCASMGAELATRMQSPGFSVVLSALVAALTVANADTALQRVKSQHVTGVGFTSLEWRNSAIIKKLKDPYLRRRKVYANAEDPVWLLARLPALPIPSKMSPHTLKHYSEFPAQLAIVCSEMRNGTALVVYFDRIKWAWYEPSAEELRRSCPNVPATIAGDGTIFGYVDVAGKGAP